MNCLLAWIRFLTLQSWQSSAAWDLTVLQPKAPLAIAKGTCRSRWRDEVDILEIICLTLKQMMHGTRELKYRCLIICRQSLIEVEENLSNNDASSSVLFNEESRFFLHLQCESCSRSRGRKGRGRGRSRCRRWESLCLQSRCWWLILFNRPLEQFPKGFQQFPPVINPDRGPVPSGSCSRPAGRVAPGLKF